MRKLQQKPSAQLRGVLSSAPHNTALPQPVLLRRDVCHRATRSGPGSHRHWLLAALKELREGSVPWEKGDVPIVY